MKEHSTHVCLGIHVRRLHDRVGKESSGSVSPRSAEQAEPTERHTACSTLGCRCAFHESSLSLQRDLHWELQMTRRLILRSVIRTSFKFAPEDASSTHVVQAQLKNAPRHLHHGMRLIARVLESPYRINEHKKQRPTQCSMLRGHWNT